MNSETTKAFQKVYQGAEWGPSVIPEVNGGSGPGSNPANAKPYMEFLQKFLSENQIQSVVDIGSGDWQFSRFINWNGIDYTGIECVPEVLVKVSQQFGNEHIKFINVDVLSNPESIPSGDLCIMKDVIQHWPNENITNFLTVLLEKKLFKYILLTNCCDQTSDRSSISMGEFIPLNPEMSPLKEFSPQVVFEYGSKKTCLIIC